MVAANGTGKDAAKAPRPETKKRINLGLQGGGSHGAFTWGVLDRLLDDERLMIDGISGTSAGALNAMILATGYIKDGTAGAKQALRSFWESVSHISWLSPIQRTPTNVFLGNWSLENSPAYLALDLASRMFSPYDLNPFDINPLRDIVDKHVDFDAVRACKNFQLFITATNVKSGAARVFTNKELTLDVAMASACLPHIFKAVEVDGEPYWDGGYMGNPSLWPMFYGTEAVDIVIVQINPLRRDSAPRTAQEIVDRINEITFNASLLRELRAIDFVSRMLKEDRLDRKRYRDIHVHIIHDEEIAKLEASSKLNTEWNFLKYQFDLGRKTAGTWLSGTFDQIGKRTSVDLAAILS